MCNNFKVPRKYQLRRRAERQAETRQRIVDAAVALHTTIGPAQTTVSAVAARAGVQRHTFYRHFPDEWSLALACSQCHLEAHPLPSPETWRSVDPGARLRTGIADLYAYYERNADSLLPIMRDADVHAITADILALRTGPQFAAMHAMLLESVGGDGPQGARAAAILGVVLEFKSWRTLRASVASNDEAIEAAVRAVIAQNGDGGAH